MNKAIYLIYETDPWHDRSSRVLVAVATTPRNRDRLARAYIKTRRTGRASRDLISEAIGQIHDINQTQCLDDELGIELLIEEIPVNEIL